MHGMRDSVPARVREQQPWLLRNIKWEYCGKAAGMKQKNNKPGLA